MNKDYIFFSKAWAILIGIPLVLNVFLAYLLCEIEAGYDYSWYSGFWHGLCAVGNFILYVFDNSRLKIASAPSFPYYLCFAIGIIFIAIIFTALQFMLDTVMKKYIEREFH